MTRSDHPLASNPVCANGRGKLLSVQQDIAYCNVGAQHAGARKSAAAAAKKYPATVEVPTHEEADQKHTSKPVILADGRNEARPQA